MGWLLLSCDPRALTPGAALPALRGHVVHMGEAETQEGQAERLCLEQAHSDFCPHFTAPSQFHGKFQRHWQWEVFYTSPKVVHSIALQSKSQVRPFFVSLVTNGMSMPVRSLGINK